MKIVGTIVKTNAANNVGVNIKTWNLSSNNDLQSSTNVEGITKCLYGEKMNLNYYVILYQKLT